MTLCVVEHVATGAFVLAASWYVVAVGFWFAGGKPRWAVCCCWVWFLQVCKFLRLGTQLAPGTECVYEYLQGRKMCSLRMQGKPSPSLGLFRLCLCSSCRCRVYQASMVLPPSGSMFTSLIQARMAVHVLSHVRVKQFPVT